MASTETPEFAPDQQGLRDRQGPGQPIVPREAPAADEPQPLRRGDFPAGFRWGCATSAYQIEGATAEGGRAESIWDRFCTVPGRILDGSSGAQACDHYHRWPEDLDLARSLGVNAYRFSVSWPRVLPAGPRAGINAEGLGFYERLVDGMLARGIEPWLTLYHWDLPQRLQDRGGWGSRETVLEFGEYAALLARHLGDRVRHWITHNEPWCSAFIAHLHGLHAPGERDLRSALRACHHILLSHGQAVQALRAQVPAARIGIALSLHPLQAASADEADRAAEHRYDGLRNRWFLDPLYGRGYPADTVALLGANLPPVQDGDLALIAAPTDFLGVNYYFPEVVAADPSAGPLAARIVEPPALERTDLGWQVAPQGMTTLLERITRNYHPAAIHITENGACFEDVADAAGFVADARRQQYLVRHLQALRTALARGLPIGGYFAWSLLDNFEWAEGYRRRFGLVRVDYADQSRRIKQSGQWYRRFLTGAA